MSRTDRVVLWAAEIAGLIAVAASISAIWTVLGRGWYIVASLGLLTVGVVLWVMASFLPLLLRPNR